jgi:hypothetical protein
VKAGVVKTRNCARIYQILSWFLISWYLVYHTLVVAGIKAVLAKLRQLKIKTPAWW